MNFSRLKKEKTTEKRDASEDKKTNEIDPATTTGTHAVKLWSGNFIFNRKYLFFSLSIKKPTYKPIADTDFQMYLDEIRPQISKAPLSEQVSTLAR